MAVSSVYKCGGFLNVRVSPYIKEISILKVITVFVIMLFTCLRYELF